jgi:hypothetical protein
VAGLALSVARVGSRTVARTSAFHIAEAGLQQQRWRLAHDPNDAGERQLAYRDATGRAAGAVTIQTGTADPCTGRTRITANASAAQRAAPNRTVEATYGRPSLAQYAFLTDSTLYFGGGGTVDGRIHANSGIRMDANQNALATSAVATYTCGAGHGCRADGEEKPGIWGSGAGQAQGLWRFPAPPVPFGPIAFDVSTLRTAAQSSGIYLEPSNAYGYYLKFKSNGIVDVHRVTHLGRPVWSWDGVRWAYESHDLSGVPALQRTVTIPQDRCTIGNLLFVEDNVWVDGTVQGRTTIVAARVGATASRYARIYLNGSLTLQDAQRDAVALIAQGDLRFPLVLPDVLNVAGVLIAQHGRIFRPYYPSTYRPWHVRPELHLNGSLITNGIAVTAWVDRNGNVVSGFQRGTNTFDARYALDPPPYVPALSEAVFLKWNER